MSELDKPFEIGSINRNDLGKINSIDRRVFEFEVASAFENTDDSNNLKATQEETTETSDVPKIIKRTPSWSAPFKKPNVMVNSSNLDHLATEVASTEDDTVPNNFKKASITDMTPKDTEVTSKRAITPKSFEKTSTLDIISKVFEFEPPSAFENSDDSMDLDFEGSPNSCDKDELVNSSYCHQPATEVATPRGDFIPNKSTEASILDMSPKDSEITSERSVTPKSIEKTSTLDIASDSQKLLNIDASPKIMANSGGDVTPNKSLKTSILDMNPQDTEIISNRAIPKSIEKTSTAGLLPKSEDDLDLALNGQEPTVKNLIFAAISVMKVSFNFISVTCSLTS